MFEQDYTFNNTLVISSKFDSLRITCVRNEKKWIQNFDYVCIRCMYNRTQNMRRKMYA